MLSIEYALFWLLGGMLLISVLIVLRAMAPKAWSPQLLPYSGEGSMLFYNMGERTPLKTVTINGHLCTVMTNHKGDFLAMLSLRQDLGLHIVALSRHGLLRYRPHWLAQALRRLEKVSLEGSFPKVFSMYCNPGAQNSVRELFEPVTMLQFYELCRMYDFELHGSSLYFSPSGRGRDKRDTTDMASDITKFLTNNQRFLAGKLR